MTYVIAEIGACHDGLEARMLDAVTIAKAAGASAAKFQWTSNPMRMAKRRGRAFEDGYAEVYRKYLAWPRERHARLRAACDAEGIDYMCTAYLPEDVPVVAAFVAHQKVASFEASDSEMLDAVAQADHEGLIIISLGMGQQLDHGRMSQRMTGGRVEGVRLLLCTSAYPAPVESLNLSRLRGGWFSGGVDGFSDHSGPEFTWTGALAVAAGAEIVEAHVRLDNTPADNPDYPHAMSPRQFTDYVSAIRFAESCLGTRALGGVQACERAMAQYRVVSEGGAEG